MNEVNLRRVRLELGWVTVSGFNPLWEIFVSLCDIHLGHLGQLSLAISSCVGARSTSHRAVTPCGLGVKVDVGGRYNCVIPLLHTLHI